MAGSLPATSRPAAPDAVPRPVRRPHLNGYKHVYTHPPAGRLRSRTGRDAPPGRRTSPRRRAREGCLPDRANRRRDTRVERLARALRAGAIARGSVGWERLQSRLERGGDRSGKRCSPPHCANCSPRRAATVSRCPRFGVSPSATAGTPSDSNTHPSSRPSVSTARTRSGPSGYSTSPTIRPCVIWRDTSITAGGYVTTPPCHARPLSGGCYGTCGRASERRAVGSGID